MSTKKLKPPESLNDREQEALGHLFLFWWAVLALAPAQQRSIRGLLVGLGFVKPKGKLALTPMGRRTIAFVQAPGRPRYPAKKAVRR